MSVYGVTDKTMDDLRADLLFHLDMVRSAEKLLAHHKSVAFLIEHEMANLRSEKAQAEESPVP